MGRDYLAGKPDKHEEKRLSTGAFGKRLKELALLDQTLHQGQARITVAELVKQVAGQTR